MTNRIRITLHQAVKETDYFRGNAVEELSSGRIYILDAGRIELFTLFHSLAVEVIPSTVREATND